MDIIRKDSSLEQEHKFLFKEYFGLEKETFIQQSEFYFSEIICKALLYTTYGGINNKYEKDIAPIIECEYIKQAVSPYLNETLWDEKNQIVVFPYKKIFYLFDDAIKEKFKIAEFVINIDPTAYMSEEWLYVIDSFLAYTNNNIFSQYPKNISTLTEILYKKIYAFGEELQKYDDLLKKNDTLCSKAS